MNAFLAIPARFGSQRLADKNILDFAGKPLILHTIDRALKVKRSGDEVCVVTNDERVAKIAAQRPVSVITHLDRDLFTDTQPSYRPCWEALKHISPQGRGSRPFQIFSVLQATTPLLPSQSIVESLNKIESGQFDSATTISPLDPHLTHWTLRQGSGKYFEPVFGHKILKTDRLQLPTHFSVNGGVKSVLVEFFEQTGLIFGERLEGVEVPFHRAIHIARREDFDMNLFFQSRLLESGEDWK